jgi:membrane fusion protein, copper/silver efflux system
MKSFFCAALLVFGTGLILGSAGCSKAPQANTTAAAKSVDYWTCTMHPSVHSKTPGKCPICSMDLVPVMKKGGQPTSAEKRVASNAKAETQSVPGMQIEGNKGPARGDSNAQSKPTEFTVPVERQQQIGVTYTEVKKQPMRYYIRSVGMLEPDQTKMFEYVARVDGYIEELKVASPGDRVSAGQPLMTIYSPDLRATEQELVNLLSQPNNTGGRSSSEQLINAAKRRLLLWNVSEKEIAGLQQTRQPSDRLILRSPFDGVVEQVPTKVGMSVKSGDKLIGMIDLTRLWLWAEFYENEIALLGPGQKVQITLSAFPTKIFDGQISVISPSIDPVKRTAKVRIDIPNSNSELRPGMYANIVAQIDAGEGLTVPVDAVLPTGMRMLAFVDKGSGKLEPRFIRVGRQFVDLESEKQERYYQVMSGLNEGERIVSSANFLIDAESQVQGAIKTWQEPESATPADTSQPGLAETGGSPANALIAVLNTYLEIRAHLAHDDFTGAKEHASELKANVEKLAAADPDPSSDTANSGAPLLKLKESADHFDPPDIERARIEFGQVSEALIGLFKQSKPQLDQTLYLVQCPMWKKSPATWIQTTPDVSNPFMGQAMASCGTVQGKLGAE